MTLTEGRKESISKAFLETDLDEVVVRRRNSDLDPDDPDEVETRSGRIESQESGGETGTDQPTGTNFIKLFCWYNLLLGPVL
jgi:hypothetical protein